MLLNDRTDAGFGANRQIRTHWPNGLNSEGTHLLGEWYGCGFPEAVLNDADTLRRVCLFVTRESGLTVIEAAFNHDDSEGVAGTVLLTESSLAIHTWPQARFVAVDVFVYDYLVESTRKMLKLYDSLRVRFRPTQENLSRVPLGHHQL